MTQDQTLSFNDAAKAIAECVLDVETDMVLSDAMSGEINTTSVDTFKADVQKYVYYSAVICYCCGDMEAVNLMLEDLYQDVLKEVAISDRIAAELEAIGVSTLASTWRATRTSSRSILDS